MQIESDRVVIYTSKVLDPDGKTLQESTAAAPDVYLHGASPVVAAVQRALAGLERRAKVEITAAPEEAFGPRDSGLVRAVPRAHWPAEVPAEVGHFAYQLAQPDGPPLPVCGTITAVDADSVHIDQNPPGAGLTLTFILEVLDVREATAAERSRGLALAFPFDLLSQREFSGALGTQLARVGADCMTPPFPWGHVLFAHILPRLAHLAGDVAELGVGLGGTSLFFAASMPERRVFALDTFEGLPPADPAQDNPYFTTGLYRGNTPLLERLHGRIHDLGLSNVHPIPGLFRDTADQLPDRLCLVHLDSDLYRSVLDSLEATYDRLEDGGVLVLDDFFHASQGPARALAAFCNRRSIAPVLHVVFPYSVFLVKGQADAPRSARCHDGNCYSFNWLRTEPLLREAVDASVQRAWPGTEAHEAASLLKAVLDAPHDRASDIYDYWRSLSALWQSSAAGFFHADRIG